MAKRSAGEGDTVARRKRTKRSTIIGKCMFLTLPPELRNQIYKYALPQGECIQVTRRLRVPALLHTCRKTRKDTLRMWYEQNEFRHIIKNCDADVPCAWYKHYHEQAIEHAPSIIYIKGKPNWDNLMNEVVQGNRT